VPKIFQKPKNTRYNSHLKSGSNVFFDFLKDPKRVFNEQKDRKVFTAN
jgi:hypothetical protein